MDWARVGTDARSSLGRQRSVGCARKAQGRCEAIGRIVLGTVLVLAGVVWTLQGLGFVGGSFMTGATIWAVIGPVTTVVGLILAGAGYGRR